MAESIQAGSVEKYRSYLRLLAGVEIDAKLQGKVDLSGVVQQTLLEATQLADQWSQWNRAQRVTWLRRALANNLCDEIRKYTNQGRDVEREISLNRALEASSQRLMRWLEDTRPSPSSQCRTEEDLIRLADALDNLPDLQRRAIQLHYLRRLTLPDTAFQLGTTRAAVAGLLFRGLRRLRELMESPATNRTKCNDPPAHASNEQ